MPEKKYSGYGYHGGGRKAKTPGEPKRLTMCIVVSREDKMYIQEQAIQAGESISAWIRKKIMGGVKKK